MDPRPYHYQYRRPRLANRTYQSLNLFQSLYHRNGAQRYQTNHQFNNNSFTPRDNIFKQSYEKQINANRTNDRRMSSSDLIKNDSYNRNISNSALINSHNPESQRPNSNRSNQSNKSQQGKINEKPSILASYGRNSMQQSNDKKFAQSIPQLNYDKITRFSIYQKQQRPYNIVGNQPRETSTQLRKYPKMTLENRLIQTGRFFPSH